MNDPARPNAPTVTLWPYLNLRPWWGHYKRPSKLIKITLLVVLIIVLVVLKERELSLFALGSQMAELVRDMLAESTFGGE